MADNILDADFLNAFGLTPDDVAQADNNPGDNAGADPDAQTQTDPQNQEGSPENQNQEPGASTEPGAQQEQTAQNADNNQRANAAFAQMRSENTALKKLVNDIAGVLGIDANTPQAQMQAAVQDAIIRAQAKQQNIDPAVLQRLSQLENYKEETEKQALTSRALMGFQTVKNQFKLSDADIDAFANQLMEAGVNPFTRDVDLVSEYKLRNFDALIAAAEQRGIAKEVERQTNVAAHSTQPGSNTGIGADNGNPDTIKSVSQLTNWFNNNTSN